MTTTYDARLGIHPGVRRYVNRIEKTLRPSFDAIDAVRRDNQLKVLEAFQAYGLSTHHFHGHTGYGYDDPARDALESIYARVFSAEDALVRPAITSGTHAIGLCLQGLLFRGDSMVAVTGRPYDTIQPTLGLGEAPHPDSLIGRGVAYREVDLTPEGGFDLEAIDRALEERPSMVYIQRSAGYTWRRGLVIAEIESVITRVRKLSPTTLVMVNNCYGEFIERDEPTTVGADVIAGSLIKNPGGGLALAGGYIAGRKVLIERIAERMTTPGLGRETGILFDQARPLLQGLFFAPTVVASALKGALLAARAYESLGYEVNPKPEEARTDIIQAIRFGSPEAVIAFCQAVQAASPVDAHITPEPWAMPGYDDPVIMAAGAFVQGSSIELSADAPIRAPHVAFLQGGLTEDHALFATAKSLSVLMERKALTRAAIERLEEA